MNSILVIGGAGYIGSHMVKMLMKHNYKITILDNLSSGFRDAILHGHFIEGDLNDRALLDNVLKRGFSSVIHFASSIQVAESVACPDKYYRNNLVNTLNLLDAMRDHGIDQLVFSSTAAIFGDPKRDLIDENHPREPINPYGRTKLMVEQVLQDYDRAFGLRSVCLRYFNAAGADPEAELGERHDPETHLIPLILQAALGRREAISVFGRDHPTLDGTCVRDYVHVTDLCAAHLLALEWLRNDGGSKAFNLGNGCGFSVQEVIDCARSVTGAEFKVVDAPRREGDPARLIADSTLARQVLGWEPKYSDLKTIVKHAWAWEQKRL